MNVALLKEIENVIKSSPESFYMGQWHSCETKHCIGGWAQALTGSPQSTNPEEMANLLGIEFVLETNPDIVSTGYIHATDHCAAGRLFYQENWPEQFYVCDEEDCEQHPFKSLEQAASARIEHFIATEGRE